MDEGGKRRLGKKGNYDCEEGSSAKADGFRVRDGTTMERLLALFHRPPPSLQMESLMSDLRSIVTFFHTRHFEQRKLFCP